MEELLSRAETILAAEKTFVLPELALSFYSHKTPVLLSAPQRIAVDRVKREGETLLLESGEKRLLLAVNPDAALKERLISGEDSALEMTIEPEAADFADRLLHSALHKAWLYNVYAHKIFLQFMQGAEALPVSGHGTRRRVADCPRQLRVSRGRPYANPDTDCCRCEFCIDSTEEGRLLCTARNRLAVPEDFDKPYEERSRLYPEQTKPLKTEAVKAGICPRCGGRLVEKKGSKGPFLGCSRYPFCHFTAERRPKGEIFFSL